MVPLPDLRKIPLFENLPVSTLEELRAASRAVDYSARQVVMQAGQEQSHVFCVLAGAVRVFRTNLDGREQTLNTLRPGAIFNLPAAFLPGAVSSASVQAESGARLLEISPADFRRIALQSPELTLAVLEVLSRRLRHFTTLTSDLSLLSVRARLARFLLNLYQDGASEPARCTQEEIAARIGTVREVVSRTLRSFAAEGYIRMERQNIVLVDIPALEAEAEGS